MFTGIVEEIGHITGISKGAQSLRLTIAGDVIFSDMEIGCSIAVNGVCLTVTEFGGRHFTADVMAESVKMTTLHTLKVGDAVNLERAMAANGLDLTFGSPLDTLVDTATLGELDALTIRSNAYREERDIRQQGANYRGQAGVDRAAASSALTGGYLNAAGTLLGGGSRAYETGKKSGAF